jgi:hypothetical protein
MRLDDTPAQSPAIEPTDAHDDVTVPRGTASGRRLRNWLIVANLMGWLLIILLVRGIFS